MGGGGVDLFWNNLQNLSNKNCLEEFCACATCKNRVTGKQPSIL